MRFISVLVFQCVVGAIGVAAGRASNTNPNYKTGTQKILQDAEGQYESQTRVPDQLVEPKIFIISMFDSETDIWHENMPSLLERNITVPGFSSLFPNAHCTSSGDVCHLTTAMGEINAAATIMALLFSPNFSLSSTYFLIAGIGGVNPHLATTGSVTFARFSVQFSLTHEFDARQIPSDWPSGLVPQGAKVPTANTPAAYPTMLYGTEAFELNDNLKRRFVDAASKARLNDSAQAAAYRSRYGFAPANAPPSVVACDTGTSDVYWSGSLLAEAFEAYALLLTNGRGRHCSSQQEDNATLEALLRGHLLGKVDFSRVAIMRTGSIFDRAPEGMSAVEHLLEADHQDGFGIAVQNIWIAGREVVGDVLGGWDEVYEGGVEAGNYVGDVLNRLGDGDPGLGHVVGDADGGALDGRCKANDFIGAKVLW